MKIQFKYYLHDNANSNEQAEFIYSQIADKFDGDEDDLRSLLGDSRPFYEVEFTCELDTSSGEVKILSAG